MATTAAQTVSSIVKEQRESKAQAATVYAAIEDKHKQVEAEINHARRELELSYQKAEREMKRQSKADDQQYQMELNKHEAKLLELQRHMMPQIRHRTIVMRLIWKESAVKMNGKEKELPSNV